MDRNFLLIHKLDNDLFHTLKQSLKNDKTKTPLLESTDILCV